MNPFKNISVFRDQDIYTNCSLKPWSNTPDPCTETTEFPDKQEWDMEYSRYKELYEGLKGNTDYATSQLIEVEHFKKQLELLKQENDRVQHLTTVLIDHIWKKQPFPLKEIDKQMDEYDKALKQSQFDDGGIDGTPRNA
jgi:hypothetical protein